MNTDTTNNSENGLQSAFGDRGTNVNSMSYGHPYGEQILYEAREVLASTETGQIFLRVIDSNNIPVIIMKGIGDGGFSADTKSIILQIPGKVKKASGEAIFSLVKAIGDADQEYSGKTAPDPMTDVMGYATFIHARNLDSIIFTCQFVKELTNSSYFSVLLDTLANLGLNSFYKAYLSGASREELYDYYAEAYDNRGSI